MLAAGINVSQAAMQMSLDALNGSTSLQHLLLGNNPSMMGEHAGACCCYR